MTGKHSRIAGFQIAQPSAARSRTTNGNRVVRRAEMRRLLEEFLARELRRSLAHTSAAVLAAPPAGASAPPRRAVSNVGRIDPSKSTLPIISEAEAKAIGGRETFMHFGLDPDLYTATCDTL